MSASDVILMALIAGLVVAIVFNHLGQAGKHEAAATEDTWFATPESRWVVLTQGPTHAIEGFETKEIQDITGKERWRSCKEVWRVVARAKPATPETPEEAAQREVDNIAPDDAS